MFYATVFRLMAQNSGTLPANTGEMTNGLFYAIMRSIDRDLGDYLHANKDRQLFTISPLMGHRAKFGDDIQIGQGRYYWIRFTLLDGELFQAVIGYILQRLDYPVLHLGSIDFMVTEVLNTPGSHPRSGFTTLEDLCHQPQLNDAITLKFRTPTAISDGKWPRSGKRFVLLPEPVAIWHNLRRQWGKRGGDDPGKTYDDWIAAEVGVVEHNIRTHLLHFNHHPQIGFTGYATFRCESTDQDAKRLWHTLSDFGFYAGVGYKTTMGMGQVEVHK